LAGSGLGEHTNIIWDPLRISATVEANKFKCGTQIGFGTSLAKTTFKTNIGGGLNQGNIQKNSDPLFISATVEASKFKFGTQLRFGTYLPKQRLRPKLAGVWARGTSQKMWDPLLISATVEASNFKFGMQLGFWTSLPKNNVFDQNWRGSGPGEHPTKCGTPYVFLQPLKLATSNLVCNLVLGLAYKNQRFGTKLAVVWARGASEKNLGPLCIFATVEASSFKYGTQIGFGTSLPKNDV